MFFILFYWKLFVNLVEDKKLIYFMHHKVAMENIPWNYQLKRLFISVILFIMVAIFSLNLKYCYDHACYIMYCKNPDFTELRNPWGSCKSLKPIKVGFIQFIQFVNVWNIRSCSGTDIREVILFLFNFIYGKSIYCNSSRNAVLWRVWSLWVMKEMQTYAWVDSNLFLAETLTVGY